MAAIASSRTGFLNGTTSGWAARSLFTVGVQLYAVVLDTAGNKIRVHKSIGDGTWTEQDSADAPTHSGNTSSYDAAMPLSGTGAGFILYQGSRPFRRRRVALLPGQHDVGRLLHPL
jgi:hypothetical protein